jgi:rod shape-determining protein MreC
MRRKPAQRIVIVLAIGLGLILIGRGALQSVVGVIGLVTNPVARTFRISGSGSGNFFSFIAQVKDLNTKNADLERQVSELKLQLSQDNELRVQDDALRKQLGFASDPAQKLLPAEIVAYQPDNFRAFLTINRGKRDGLRDGQAVISEGTLVGKLTEVTDTTAKVFLVIDPDFRIAALDQVTRASGTVHGQIGSGLVMEKIPQDQVVKVGDTVITSGLGGELPKGLVLGQIESLASQDNDIFQTAQVSTPLHFSQLELVFVVTSS